MTTPRFRFRVDERSPGHTTFTVFVGQPGQGGNAGKLTFANEEYDQLAPLLLAAPNLLAVAGETLVGFENVMPEHLYKNGCFNWDVPTDNCPCLAHKIRRTIEAATA
jgi:hypothetical protein